MWMAPDELLTDDVRDLTERKRAALFRDLGLHQDLEQHVAQFAAELRHGALVNRLEHLVGLLEHAGPQRAVRLLAIPGTALGRSKAVDHRDQFFQALEIVSHPRPPPPCG
jgi:hypothetical protein